MVDVGTGCESAPFAELTWNVVILPGLTSLNAQRKRPVPGSTAMAVGPDTLAVPTDVAW